MDEIIDKLQEWEDSKAPLSSYQRSVCLDIAEKTSERLISGNVRNDFFYISSLTIFLSNI